MNNLFANEVKKMAETENTGKPVPKTFVESNPAAKADAGKAVAKTVPEKAVEKQRRHSDSPVILYPLTTEKGVSGIEARNEIVVVVSKDATKPLLRAEAEKMFGSKVARVRTSISAGKKKAVLKFVKQGAAADVAAKLKII